MKFALNTAFSGASIIITEKTNVFNSKENEYKNQIAELQKKITPEPNPNPTPQIPKEVQDQIDELKRYKDSEAKKAKQRDILELAKKSVRQDLHKALEKYAANYEIKLDKEDKEQADALVAQFQEIIKDSIGDIKPLAPQQTHKRDEEVLNTIPIIKV